MGSKATTVLVTFSLILINLLLSCSSKNSDTTILAAKTITPQASAIPTSTIGETTIPAIETTTPQTSAIQILTAEPIAIKAYDAEYMTADYEYGEGFSSIKDTCVLCHGPGTGYSDIQAYGVNPGGSQFPLPPTWFGSRNTPGLWQVLPGSAADHTDRTNEQCLYCHRAP